MQSDNAQLGPFYNLWVWAINHRQKLIAGGIGLIVLAGAFAIYSWTVVVSELGIAGS